MAVLDVIVGYVRGLKGDTGATGATGATGPGATVSVGTVTTTTYGNPAQVTNSGTETNARFDFVIPQGAPGSEVTDVSSLTLNSVTDTAASFPIPAVGEVMSVIMGKIIKFFGDTVSALNAKLNKSDVTTSLGTTTTGKALDATAGKVLNDKITTLNDSLAPLVQTYTPTISWTGGSGLTVDNIDFRYLRVSKNVYWVTGRFDVTSVGTPGGGLSISYPSVGSAFYSTNVGAGGVFIGAPGTDFSHAKIASLSDRIQVTRTPGGDSWSTFSTGLYAIGCFVFVVRE